MKYNFPDLLPCPFCGFPAIRVQHPGIWKKDKTKDPNINDGALEGSWYVGCPSEFFQDGKIHCEINPSAKWYSNLEDAENDWNRRNGTD